LLNPVGEGLILHVGDHGAQAMFGSMKAEFEPLDSSPSADCSHYVLAFVSIRFPGGWQAFALDWQKHVELRVPTTFNDEDRTARLRSQVDVPTGRRVVWNFSTELDPAPTIRRTCCAVQVIAEMVGQGGL
jgi:hypothetical protein